MDADLVRQIWLRADRVREHGLHTPDLTDLVDIASEFGAVDWKLVSDLSVLLDRRLGDVARPRVVLEFINELSRRLHPGRVLDPFVVNPAVLVSAVDTPFRPAGTGVVRVDRAAELGERLAPDVDWQREDPLLTSAAQWDAQYDLIVSAPPFGGRVDASLLCEGEPGTLANDAGDLVLFRALRRLSPSGVALVQVSDSYFWNEGRLKTRRALESSGYHLSGVFSISETGIAASSAIVLTRFPVDSLFVGRLKEAASVATLVENFLSRRPGDVFELGRLVPVDEYGGWERHTILSAWGGTAAPIRLGDIAKLKMRSIAAGETLTPEENTIYIPTVGTGPVTTISPSYIGNGKYRVLEAALDSKRARADYVAEWLSSAVGVAARRAFTAGSTIPHMTATGAASVPINLPSIELQDRVTRAAQQLHSMQARVLQLRESLWSNPLTVWPRVAPELSRAARADPLRASAEGLPYPLASVLHQYMAKSAIDRKVSRLVQYFEATAAFSAILLLSAFRRDDMLFGNVLEVLTKNSPEKRRPPMLDRVDFGQWITLGFTLAKAARRVDNDKALVSAWSQAVGPASAVATLLSTADYWKLLDQARPIRNERAHGGIDSDTQSKAWLRQLEGILYELVRVTGSVWEEARLLLPNNARLQSGVWTYPQAKLLAGSNDIFEEVEFTSLEPIETGQLVFAPQGQGHDILPVVPLVRLSTPSTHGGIACYFFSAREGRDTFKYVSYHYEDEPQKTFADARVSDLIRWLTPPNDQGFSQMRRERI